MYTFFATFTNHHVAHCHVLQWSNNANYDNRRLQQAFPTDKSNVVNFKVIPRSKSRGQCNTPEPGQPQVPNSTWQPTAAHIVAIYEPLVCLFFVTLKGHFSLLVHRVPVHVLFRGFHTQTVMRCYAWAAALFWLTDGTSLTWLWRHSRLGFHKHIYTSASPVLHRHRQRGKHQQLYRWAPWRSFPSYPQYLKMFNVFFFLLHGIKFSASYVVCATFVKVIFNFYFTTC